MEKVKVGDKEYTIKEIKYMQAVELENLPRPQMARKLLTFSVGLTDEEIDNLSLKEGIELQNAVNKLNGIGVSDFHKPAEDKES